MPHARDAFGLLLVVAACLHLATESATADEQTAPAADQRGIAFFETSIRPVLVERCYQCHSHEAGKTESDLALDTRAGIRAGGVRGPAVVPGDLEASLLLSAISHADPDLTMPPKGDRLRESVVDDFKSWIRMGAHDPRETQTAAVRISTIDIEAGRQFWAYQKPVDHPLPSVQDAAWPNRELDHFILARLESSGLTPSRDAEPATLLRRLHFDLVGLPPAPQAVRRFLRQVERNGLDAALSTEVDALLASDDFGERWGRHWLDVARYAESSGKESNLSFPHAWRYRDYVIDSVNEDKPFDRFIVEQVAGDLLPFESDAERAELLIATGFLAMGPKGLNEMNGFQFLADVADEQIDTVTRAVMGSTVSCARCHDHKFDPFTMEDYYALAGIFISTQTLFGTSIGPENQIGGDLVRLPEVDGQLIPNKSIGAERAAALKADLAALNKEEKDRRAAAREAAELGKDPGEFFSLRDALRIIWRRGAIEGQLETIDDQGRALPLAMGVVDREQAIDAPLLERGELSRPGERIPRRFPQVIEVGGAHGVTSDDSGRLALARWLTHADHPLTARVMANRVWRHLFGAGIVRTVDNFGANGERPSHPELLDHLAIRLVDGGWSVKSLIREIVLSRTYRQASTYRDDFFRIDPDNRLLWRASKRRLDAEAIRDAMLAVSGELDRARPAASLVAQIGDRPISIIGFDARVPADLDGSRHRSVYLPVLRDRLPDVLDLFDFAEPSLVTGDRDTTNVPVQALYLMNGDFVRERAKALAARVIRQTSGDEEAVRYTFLLCFGRAPDDAELQLALDFLAAGGEQGLADESARAEILASYCQALVSTAEFRNLD